MTVLAKPRRGTHDEAHQHVAEARREATGIERRQRRHHVVGRAERVVLVTVLDVRNSLYPKEPGRELDAGQELARIQKRLLTNGSEQQRFHIALHPVPVELPIVVPWNDGQPVAGRDELGERGEHRTVSLGDACELHAGVVLGRPEAVRPLFLARLDRKPGAGGADGDSHEVDEVSIDDEMPRTVDGACVAIVIQQRP